MCVCVESTCTQTPAYMHTACRCVSVQEVLFPVRRVSGISDGLEETIVYLRVSYGLPLCAVHVRG